MNYDPKTEPGTLTMHIRTDGAAFHDEDGAWEPWPELARIFTDLSAALTIGGMYPGHSSPIRDTNGNTVGAWRINRPEEVQP